MKDLRTFRHLLIMAIVVFTVPGIAMIVDAEWIRGVQMLTTVGLLGCAWSRLRSGGVGALGIVQTRAFRLGFVLTVVGVGFLPTFVSMWSLGFILLARAVFWAPGRDAGGVGRPPSEAGDSPVS